MKPIKPASPLAKQIRTKILGISRTIDKREAEVRVLQRAKSTYWLRWISAQFGLHLGMRVWTDKTTIYGSAPKRREYVVESIREELSADGRPWITGRLILKDGSVSKTVTHPLYDGWRFTEKPRA